jgi:ferredoxin
METGVQQGRQLQVDDVKCIGCMACSNTCPEKLITLSNLRGRRVLRFGDMCGRHECSRCIEACPEEALSFTEAGGELGESPQAVSFEMACCQRCGVPFTPRRLLDALLNRFPDFLKLKSPKPTWLHLCPQCRRYEEAKGVGISLPAKN